MSTVRRQEALIVGDSDRGARAAVPRHTEIDDVLAKEICKQLEIPRL